MGGCFWQLDFINSAGHFCSFCFFIHNFFERKIGVLGGGRDNLKN